MRTFVLGGLAGGLSVVLALVALYQAVDRQAERDETRPADVIIVLGSQVRADGEPSNSLRSRTLRGVQLYQEGYAPLLLLTGGVGRFPPAEAQVMRRLALQAGIPDDRLVLDETATSTQESIETAARLARERGWRTVLIVSDPFHIYRARQMARDAGLDAYGAPAYQSHLYTMDRLRRYYTVRESFALLWYYTLGRLTMTNSLTVALRELERLRFGPTRHVLQGTRPAS
ncbi:MAG: YdcF family protein [Anaerolineae bacterium]|nr:YdcF family protein [Anaerolineae bacterium]